MAHLAGEFSFFQGVHARIDMRIDISISIRLILQAGTSTGFDSNKANQPGAADHVTN